jgi:hypothetical protein
MNTTANNRGRLSDKGENMIDMKHSSTPHQGTS